MLYVVYYWRKCATACVWSSEDSFVDLVLSFQLYMDQGLNSDYPAAEKAPSPVEPSHKTFLPVE